MTLPQDLFVWDDFFKFAVDGRLMDMEESELSSEVVDEEKNKE